MKGFNTSIRQVASFALGLQSADALYETLRVACLRVRVRGLANATLQDAARTLMQNKIHVSVAHYELRITNHELFNLGVLLGIINYDSINTSLRI